MVRNTVELRRYRDIKTSQCEKQDPPIKNVMIASKTRFREGDDLAEATP